MKKSCFVWIILLICNMNAVKAQVIKVENGISISSLNVGKEGYNGSLTFYQMSLGIEYMDRGWYGLSSSIGYLRKGTNDDVVLLPNESEIWKWKYRHSFDYLTLNTTFRVKGKTSDKFSMYAGVGPRLDFHLKQKFSIKGDLNYDDNGAEGRPVIPGLKCEIGMDYYFNLFRIGVNVGYLPSFIKPLPDREIKERTFTAGIVLGYVL